MEESQQVAPLLVRNIEKSESICGICLCTISDKDAVELECNHAFHASCAVDWFRTRQSGGRCPICRDVPPALSSLRVQQEDDGGVMGVTTLNELFGSSIDLNTLHNTIAPWIYDTTTRARDRVLNALLDRYMRRRRLHRRAMHWHSMGEPRDGEVDKCERWLLQAGYGVLIYTGVEEVIHP